MLIDNESDGNANDDLVCVKLKVEETKLRRAGEGNLEVLFCEYGMMLIEIEIWDQGWCE